MYPDNPAHVYEATDEPNVTILRSREAVRFRSTLAAQTFLHAVRSAGFDLLPDTYRQWWPLSEATKVPR